MSLFIVQVMTGKEVKVFQELSKKVASNDSIDIKGLFVKNTYTYLNKKIETVVESFSEEPLTHLKQKKIEFCLKELKKKQHQSIANFKEQYEKYHSYVQFLSQELEKMRNLKQLGGLLTGYLIIETNNHYTTIPATLYQFIKSLNYVISIPNRNSVPVEEIESFFQALFSSNQLTQKIESKKVEHVLKSIQLDLNLF